MLSSLDDSTLGQAKLIPRIAGHYKKCYAGTRVFFIIFGFSCVQRGNLVFKAGITEIVAVASKNPCI